MQVASDPLFYRVKIGSRSRRRCGAPGGGGVAGVGRSESRRWNTRRGTVITPRYSPISTPNSTACRSPYGARPRPEMATELADLVIVVIKRARATASLARDYTKGCERPTEVTIKPQHG